MALFQAAGSEVAPLPITGLGDSALCASLPPWTRGLVGTSSFHSGGPEGRQKHTKLPMPKVRANHSQFHPYAIGQTESCGHT